MRLLGLLLLLSFSFSSIGQIGKLAKADGLFAERNYVKAADSYEALLGSPVEDAKMLSKLSLCYYKIDEYQLALDTYAEFIEGESVAPQDYLLYAEVLKIIGNYAESDIWMTKYAETVVSDSRGKAFLNNLNYKDDIESIDPYFSMKEWGSNADGTDFGGYYNANEDELYFLSGRKKEPSLKNGWSWKNSVYLDVYVKESNNDEVFGVGEISDKKLQEGPLAFTPDGKKVYFTRNIVSTKLIKKGVQKMHLKLYEAEIDADGFFFNEKELSLNANEYSVGHPSVSADGKFIYFISDKPGGYGGFDIYRAEINQSGNIVNEQNLGSKLNSEGDEFFPFVDAEGKLFFSSDGHIGLGGLDVFIAEVSEDGKVGTIRNVGKPVNSQYNDYAFTLNKELSAGFVTSDRNKGRGMGDIFSLSTIKPFTLTPRVTIKGKTRDNKGTLIANADVELSNDNGEVIKSLQSNQNGEFSFEVEKGKNYTLVGTKEGLNKNEKNINTNIDNNSITADLILSKESAMSLHGIVTDAKTGLPIDGVHIYLRDAETGVEKELSTSATGEFTEPLDKQLNEEGTYSIDVRKTGYYPNSFVYSTVFTENGEHSINAKVNLAMTPVSSVDQKVAEIDMIFFDFDKSYIRPDAQKGLDRIVELMNQYPELVIELGSHCDCRGTEGYNVGLSDRRAKSTADYIKQRISNPERIFGKGYGKTRLLNECECESRLDSNCSEEEHQMNRRSEFRIISGSDNLKIINHSANSFD